VLYSFLFQCSYHHRDLHSFPTRRSSDLYRLSAYRNQVDDFIFAADAGYDPGGDYRVVEYQQADAVLQGLEGSLGIQATERLRVRSEEHTSELQSRENLVCRLLLEKKK